MQTVQLEIPDEKLDTFLTIIENLKKDIVQSIHLKRDDLKIEPIPKDSQDYKEIEATKAENNPRYTIEEAKAKLGL